MTAKRSVEELKAQAVQLRRAGKSRREIRKTLQVGQRLIDEALKGEPAPEWTRRPRAKDDLRDRARELRADGMTYQEIAAALGVSKGSCSLWLRDMPRPVGEDERRRRAAVAIRETSRRRQVRVDGLRLQAKLAAAREIGPLAGRDVVLAGAILYWCEGAKAKPHRRKYCVDFCNSDPAVIQLFLRFLAVVGVTSDRLRFQLQIHDSADLVAAQRFWTDLTGQTQDRFRKPIIKKANPATNRRNTGATYHGCLRLTVRTSDALYYQIEGWAGGAMEDLPCRFGPQSSACRFTADVDPVIGSILDIRERALRLRRAGRSRREIQATLHVRDDQVLDQLLEGEPPAEQWLRAAAPLDRLEERARDLRGQGWGYRRIAAGLGVPREQVRVLLAAGRPGPEVSDRAGEPARRAEIQRYWHDVHVRQEVARRIRAEAARREVGELTDREIKLLGSLTYWCEGQKDKPYRRKERVSFVNSDPRLMAFFRGFVNYLGVPPDQLVPRVHIHETGDVASATSYWAEVIGIDAAKFRTPVIKRHKPKTQHDNVVGSYNGCLRLDVAGSAGLYRRIEGWALGGMLGEEGARQRWTPAASPDGDDRSGSPGRP